MQRRFEAEGLSSEVADAAIEALFEPRRRRWDRRVLSAA